MTTKTERIFIDSNVLLYQLSADSVKAEKAHDIVRRGPSVSVQVLNEFSRVANRKFKKSWDDIAALLELAKLSVDVHALTLETHERALEIVLATDIGIFDANIVAAAQLAGCTVLYTEDLNDGQRFGGVTIVNPFK